MTYWNIISVYPQCDFDVSCWLYDRGHETYCPYERIPRQANGFTRKKRERRRWKTIPLLPGYVFIKTPESLPVGLITDLQRLKARNMVRELWLLDTPRMRIQFFDQLEAFKTVHKNYDPSRVRSGEHVMTPEGLMKTGSEFKPGDTVRIYDGPLSEHELKVTSVGVDGFAKLLMHLFGSEMEVKAKVGDLEKVA